MFESLLQPVELGKTRLRNRIFNPPHGTTLGHQGMVTDDLIAYHLARARGGVGLIIMESMTVHPSYGFEQAFLYAGSDRIIDGLNRLVQSCRAEGTPVFGQLFHAGRGVRLSHDGSRPLSYSASDVPDERYRVVPVPMPNEMVWEMIESYAAAAGRLADADLDGVEILASMGYLIAQFLNPTSNRREDEFGGSLDNRMRFLREVIDRSRDRIGPDKTLGIRVTLDEKTENALPEGDMIAVCQALDADGKLDYFSVISGSSATPGGWIHVFPPMAVTPGFVVDDAARLKQSVSKPVLVAGRINQPQLAAQIIDAGSADMVGMARALIADPEFVNKVENGRAEDIRACVGCNQACVGHRLAHFPVSCIQNPPSGRERSIGSIGRASKTQTILVIGGGPAGMKAAAVAAERGHRVQLHEISGRLGGQVNLAEALPGRAEFGGVTTNLQRELQNAGVDIQLNSELDAEAVRRIDPQHVIIAIGARPRQPEVEVEGVEMVDAWAVIGGQTVPGNNVVIADWSCDWSGLGVAEKLARDGHHVRLLSGGSVAGESIQAIVRDQWIGVLHGLGVEMTPFARFYGALDGSAYFQHMTGGEAIVCEAVDSIVTCFAPQASRACDWLERLDGFAISRIGDAVAPRTVEEAVLEGFRLGRKL
ncbi:MAG: FAD-dependent oxidoreductase [Gammaproteobacteria bacterium]|nr:MAG: FAD-dependent oxidoreductase [Gammaproteobacteria bacterium]UCH41844.1 MAG: FAD-dependent oxidoreductase [Gammaproteobacteria bacterium]